MKEENFIAAICGPPLAANTAISKDVGIYAITLPPSYALKASFKKSSSPRHGLAISSKHVFTAQDKKAHVHVYSRTRGAQEALVSFAEGIRSIALAGNVLILGTTEGRLILWETCTGRQVATPPCHVQAVSCLATTEHYVLSGSDDSNINVWSLARLLELGTQHEAEPERILSNHRGAITDVAVGQGSYRHSSICVSASKDKTCIIWNYATGHALRTILFPTAPICLRLDPAGNGIYVAAEGRAVYSVELFGEKPLLGSYAQEPSSILVQITEPLAVAEESAGEINCLDVSYDAQFLFTGHTSGRILQWLVTPGLPPTELANLNSSVTNLDFTNGFGSSRTSDLDYVVKPNQNQSQHTLTAQLQQDQNRPHTRFDQLFGADGFPSLSLETASLELPEHLRAKEKAEEEEKEWAARVVHPSMAMFLKLDRGVSG